MNLRDRERILDAIQHCGHAIAVGTDQAAPPLGHDDIRVRALLYNLIVVGTTLGRLSPELKALGDLPLREIVDTRNRLVHAYWQIDLSFLNDL